MVVLLVLLVVRNAWAAQGDAWDFLFGERVAMLAGAPFDEAVYAANPEVGEILHYQSMPDALAALRVRSYQCPSIRCDSTCARGRCSLRLTPHGSARP